MKKYAKVINDETKLCIIGTGDNIEYYISQGMEEKEVEQAYNGCWYLSGYAPQKPIEKTKEEKREERNFLLTSTDKYLLSDFPISAEEREKWVAYRKYLRDYTKQENWWESEPLTFDEWKLVQEK